MTNLKTIIKEYFSVENRKDRFGNELYRTLGDYNFFYYLKEKLNMAGRLSAYTGYLFNDDTKCIITFVEGDFYLKVHVDDDLYKQDKEETHYLWSKS